ncbi:MAG: gamma-glutamyltransferase [Armatimonadota bacterium]|nr:gamma-glutamyltransferase [Armatimonadota bacterium]MDR7389546.1 gamma-glutamyltransferase [Armatimonadota bacterium]MDR7393822.1 gamma-glutamyltransferase [Armatimonadota bacterium]MDR7397293.1 gamma-glutamyltransferase [Armatimonadota bacterium]MDR7400066.1 gamma-glutamyltransferase [Armatimonadota bacterium]
MFPQGRSVVMARRGMVASGHPLASAAGLRVLMSGGNAIDGAVATAAVLGVVQPMMSGVGGDTFLLYYPAREGRVWALNGSGIAPYAASRQFFLDRGYTRMPFRGMLSVSVPGAVDAMVTALERWGTGRFSLAQLLEPAIFYAEEGFPVTEKVSVWIAEAEEVLKAHPSTARIYLPQGRPPRPGEVLVQKDLAQTLRRIAQGGREVFYRGELARSIVRYCREHGGLLTEREFAEHQSEIYAPLETTYRGYRVLTTAPPSQGLILLEMLNILEEFELSRLGWGSPDTVHLMVEAKKVAFADRLGYVGDPRFVDNPVGTLLSKEYARRRAREIHPFRASAEPRPGSLREELGATTYFAVADAEGNLVSYITSLSASFGCAQVVEGTGILLNNRAGRGFTLEAGHPNVIAPGKRTMHTLMSFMALYPDGRPFLVWGTPGGDGQPQWCAQVFTNLVDFGMNVQQAVEAPRWLSFPGTDPADLPAPFELRVEPGFAEEAVEELQRRGHRVIPMSGFAGGAQVIQVDPAGVYHGGSDPRVDGAAMGW